MIAVFKSSKKNAKKRLFECIKRDRESVCEKSLEVLGDEIGEILKKYVKTDGKTRVALSEGNIVITARVTALKQRY